MNHPIRAALVTVLATWLGASALAQTPPACPPVAREPSPEQLQAGLRDARDHGFLWRISKDGRSSWLFGTLHVAKLAWDFPGPAQREAMAQSDTVALEIDLLDPAMRQRMATALSAQPKTPLPPALQERLTRRVQAECLPPTALDALAPEMQVAVLSTLAGRRDGLDPVYGIDTVLAGWGRAAKKDMVSLETPELQLKMLQMQTPAETLEMVESSLDELESGRALVTLRRLARIWADGDLPDLLRYESWCECIKTHADRAAMVRMIDDRNPALADSIAELHAVGQRVFAAVGSLHMIGPTGLPTLMAQRGYRVERIVYKQNPQETSP
ncbi:MAG: TraB/GumN family protein [Burkholderiales bacterium]